MQWMLARLGNIGKLFTKSQTQAAEANANNVKYLVWVWAKEKKESKNELKTASRQKKSWRDERAEERKKVKPVSKLAGMGVSC